MGRKKSYITFKDQFCGAGGWSQAVRRVSKRRGNDLHVEIALNHWPVAILTHNTNFQETKHDCADISSTDPRRYASTDFLLTSPECTKQGKPDGTKKPKKQMKMFYQDPVDAAAEKSRATMWDVPRYAEYHKYNYIIAENVPQARNWICFDDWLRAMHTLGYSHKIVYFNSMFAYPVPQSRDRMYVHFWKKGNKEPDLNYRPLAYCDRCGKDVHAQQSWKDYKNKAGIYGIRGQYQYCCPNDGSLVNPYYNAAINVIDWQDMGTRIGDRTKPLAKNTLRRILAGKKKMSVHPFYIQAEHSRNLQNIRSMLDTFPTQATRQTLGLVFPFVVDKSASPEHFKSFISYYYGGSHCNSHILDAANTLTTVQGSAIIRHASEDINEWYYRMIKPVEGKRIMNFDEDYFIAGNSKEQFIQLGNAITPAAVEWQIEKALETFN